MASEMEVDGARPQLRDMTGNIVSNVGDTTLSRDSPDYNIYREGCKRLVLTIVNKTFSNSELENRSYAQMDSDLNVFAHHLGFDPTSSNGKTCVENVTYDQLEYELKMLKSRMDKENVSCVAVIVSSHGKEDAVPATRRLAAHRAHFIICSDNKAFPTTKMVDILTCTKKVVPVIYLIQACRSNQNSSRTEQIDTGVSISLVNENSDDEDYVPNQQEPEPPRESYPVRDFHHLPTVPPCGPESVVVFASSEGKKSYEGRSTGSWLLDSMQLVVDEMLEKENYSIKLFPFLYKMNHKIAGKETTDGKLKSAGSFTHQMTKTLLFTLNR